jgi:hypothetical protein
LDAEFGRRPSHQIIFAMLLNKKIYDWRSIGVEDKA